MRLKDETKGLIILVVFIDIFILLNVRSQCGYFNYPHLLFCIVIQAYSLSIVEFERVKELVKSVFDIKTKDIYLSVLFLLPSSFYAIYLAKKGVTIYGGISTCSRFL